MQRIKNLQLTSVQLYLITLVVAIGAVWTDQFHAWLPALQSITPVFADLTMLAFALPIILLVRNNLRLGVVLIAIGIGGFLLEHISSQIGIPYGFFSYLDGFGLTIAGTPVVISLAWIVVIMGCYAAAAKAGVARVAIAAVLAVILDLTLDPAAVGLGYWSWQETGFYYSIPLSNFFGWLVAALSLGGLRAFAIQSHDPRLQQASLLSLFLVASFWTNAAILQGLWIAAAIGIGFIWFVHTKRQHAAP